MYTAIRHNRRILSSPTHQLTALPQEGSLLAGLHLPVEYTLGPTKPKCHLNLGNLMEVQERHITQCKCRDSGSKVLASLDINAYHPLHALTGGLEAAPAPNLTQTEYPVTPEAAQMSFNSTGVERRYEVNAAGRDDIGIDRMPAAYITTASPASCIAPGLLAVVLPCWQLTHQKVKLLYSGQVAKTGSVWAEKVRIIEIFIFYTTACVSTSIFASLACA
ncbi:hypothetical protein J6590_015326 [Homalodisca vitripennis]|nr:hypothetical protein J6590_015326 [Homalodisca vitripennis]